MLLRENYTSAGYAYISKGSQPEMKKGTGPFFIFLVDLSK